MLIHWRGKIMLEIIFKYYKDFFNAKVKIVDKGWHV